MTSESTVAGQGSLLGFNQAQDSISALTRTINDLTRGLQGVNTGIGQVSRARGIGLALGDVWNGTSNFANSQPNGGQGGSRFGNGGTYRFTSGSLTLVGNTGGGNNGGQGGSGGSGPGTRRMGGGAANNGGRPTFKSGLQGIVKWGQKELPDQVTMQTTAYQAAQYSSQSWHNLRDAAFKNNFTAQSTQDAAQAYSIMAQMGLSPGTSAYNTQWNYIKGTSGYVNPGMSQAQRAQGTAAAWNAGTYNTLRGFGIQTIKNGSKQTPRQIAQQIYQRFPELKRVTTAAQLSATLDDPASGLNQSLNSWGLDANTLELVKGELKGMLLAQVHGGTAQTYTNLANQRDNGKTQQQKNAAQSALGKMGIGGSTANTLMTRAGTLRNQDVNINDAFTEGLQGATKALDAFSTSLQKILQVSGADGIMGWAGGAGSLLGSSISGGLGALGIARGLGSASRLLGMPGGAGGGMLNLSMSTLGKAGAYGLGAWGVHHFGNQVIDKHVKGKTSNKLAHVGVDTATGALTGAAIGSVVPVIGTGIGAGIGAGVGALAGIFGGGTGGNAAAATGAGGGGAAATGTQGAGKTAAAVIRIAEKYLGTPYKWGGGSPQTGFDCSGLMQFAFKQIGVSLPRTAAQQQKVGKAVPMNQVRAGDLMFVGNPAHHVVLCIGNGKCLEAPHTGASVRIRSFSPGEFTNARRILGSVGNMNDQANDNSDTAGSTSNRLSTMGFGGDVGNYGSTEEVDAIAAGISTIGAANLTSGVGAGQHSSRNTDNGSTASGPLPSGNLKTWIKSALGILKQDTPANERYVNTIAMHESGGNPRSQNNTDANAKAGHPSKGIMQTIDSTFNAYALPGHKNIWNPVDNIIAGVRYEESRYGSLANAPGIKSMANGGSYKGYAVGSANIDVDQTARVHKGEMIIPAYQAEALRKSLASNTPLTGGVGGLHTKGATPTLNFHAGSVVVKVQGAMDQQSARDAAQKFIQAIAEDDRINLIAAGN
jgi:SLT domain-containing protein/cell wall-associated NlpC family hydrolase